MKNKILQKIYKDARIKMKLLIKAINRKKNVVDFNLSILYLLRKIFSCNDFVEFH